MGGSFFDTLSAEEKQSIRQKTDGLIRLMEKWVTRYSFIRPDRIPRIALVIATVMPRLDQSCSALMTKLALWVFGVDDMIDEGAVPLVELQEKVIEQCHLIANGSPSNRIIDSDELAAMLSGIRKDLSEYRLFEPLCEHWSTNVRLLVEAMTEEYQYGLRYSTSGACALPSLEEYLQHGIYSSGVPLMASTLFIILNDPSVEQCFDSINEPITCASAAMRLYNDVKTFEKETQESKINSVLIGYHAMLDENPGTTEQSVSRAKHYISQMADSYAQRCYDLTRRIGTESGQFEEIIHHLVAFHASYYREHDYHSTPIAEVSKLLGTPQNTSQ